MKFLVVLSVAIASVQCGVVLPYAGFGHGYGYGLHAVPTVAKSTIKYKTAAFEPVDVATPADAIKIELVETEHEQDVFTPTITYAAHGYAGLGHAGLGYAGLGHAGLGYAGLGYAGLGYHGLGYGLPLVAAAPAAAEE